jgi:hypothetical protein
VTETYATPKLMHSDVFAPFTFGEGEHVSPYSADHLKVLRRCFHSCSLVAVVAPACGEQFHAAGVTFSGDSHFQ